MYPDNLARDTGRIVNKLAQAMANRTLWRNIVSAISTADRTLWRDIVSAISTAVD